jgi:thiosulfate/3-mercaptopyruvate sulfurtransferase
LSTEEPRRAFGAFTPRAWPSELLADVDEAAGGSFLVLDARDVARFRGDSEPVDPRAGHIPGARNLPCRDNVDADGRFLPVPELRRRFEAVGVTDGTKVISYCGSGVTACHNLLALEHAGFPSGRLYPGSWSQWSNDPDRPAATGD